MKDLRKRSIVRTTCLFATLMLSLAAVASAQDRDDRSCSPASVAGRWGYTETGTVYLPTGPVPYASVGIYTLDEDGNLWGTRTASKGGTIVPATIKGTATVNEDCTGTLTLGFYDEHGNQTAAAVKFVVYDHNASEARAIVTLVPGPNGTSVPTVLTTNAIKLFHHRPCSTARLAGEWGYTFTGTLIPPIGAMPFAGVGRATFDEEGNVLNTQFSSANGVVSPSTVKGTITVDPDCTGTILVDIYDQSGNLLRKSAWFAVVDDYAREIRAIMTSLELPNGTKVPAIVTMINTKQFSGRRNEQ